MVSYDVAIGLFGTSKHKAKLPTITAGGVGSVVPGRQSGDAKSHWCVSIHPSSISERSLLNMDCLRIKICPMFPWMAITLNTSPDVNGTLALSIHKKPPYHTYGV